MADATQRANCGVIIPAFNAGEYLREAIDSVLSQSLPAATVVVVDDGSTDNTPQVCQAYGDAIKYVPQQNAGVSAARNHGAQKVSTDWMLFLDADDRLLPDALDRLNARAAEGHYGVVYGKSIYFNADTGKRRTHGHEGSEGPSPAGTLGSFWKSAIATPGAAMIRAQLFREIGGFDSRVNSLADRDFWIKAGVLMEFGFAGVPVIEKREHGANMSGNLDRALYQAAFVQLGFLKWCRARGIDPSFLDTSPEGIVDNALRKAVETRSVRGIGQIAGLADEQGIRTPLLAQARRYSEIPVSLAKAELHVRSALHRLSGLFSS